MDKAIRDFAKQFGWKPEIVHAEKVKPWSQVVVGGMGGSHLSADLLSSLHTKVSLLVHRNYGLPFGSDAQMKDTLYIASSYSGNTEETIDFVQKAFEKGLNVVALAVSGKLIEFAQAKGIPHIVLPNTGIQPRSALGFSILALVRLLGNEELSKELSTLETKLQGDSLEQKGKEIAEKIAGFVPVIYASENNIAVAYNWKIKFNETGKVPAFSNVFPELNHNEMTGYDYVSKSKALSEKFVFLFLTDSEDHPQIRKRFEVTKKLYEDRGFTVHEFELTGSSRSEKVFTSLLLADWVAYNTAILNGAEPEQVPMVEQFKRLIV